MEKRAVFRFQSLPFFLQLVLSDDQIVFFYAVPKPLLYTVAFILAFGLGFLSLGIIYYDNMLWTYFNQNSSFRLTMGIIWIGLVAMSIFIPMLWESGRISRMKTEELEKFVRERISKKVAKKREWEEVENATLKSVSRVEIHFIGSKGWIKSKLKQVYLYHEDSPDKPQLILSDPEFQLQQFLSRQLGERLLVLD